MKVESMEDLGCVASCPFVSECQLKIDTGQLYLRGLKDSLITGGKEPSTADYRTIRELGASIKQTVDLAAEAPKTCEGPRLEPPDIGDDDDKLVCTSKLKEARGFSATVS